MREGIESLTAPTDAGERHRWVTLSAGAIAGQLVFMAGMLVAGLLEGDGYSAVRHSSSDLASLTAHTAPLMLAVQAIGGALTVVFAIGALRPALAVAERRSAIGPWLVAGSLVGLELVTELVFRIDCRAADAGCTLAVATASWHGKLHLYVGIPAGLMTVAAPFVLARRMRLCPGWRDLFWPAIGWGAALVASMVGYGVFAESGVSGLLNRAPVILAALGVVVLALRVRRLARSPGA